MSFPLPPPPDLLRIAMAAQENRRRAEQERLQQVMFQQEQQAHLEDQGIKAILAGGKLKDVEGAYGSEASEATRARWRIFESAQKQKKKEEEASEAQDQLGQLLKASGGVVQAIPPDVLAALTSQMGAGGVEDPNALVARLSGVEQTLAALDQFNQERESLEKIDFESRKAAAIARATQQIELSTHAAKTEMGRQAEIKNKVTDAAIDFYSNELTDALVSSNGQADPRALYEKVLSDPLIGGDNAPASFNLIMMNSLSNARAAQPAIEVMRDIRERSGITIPRRVADAVVKGEAVEEQFSGLPVSVPTQTERQGVALGSTMMTQFSRARALADLVVENKTAGRASEALLSPLARAVGMAPEDPFLNEYATLRDQLGALITLRLSGQAAAEKQEARFQGLMPKAAELIPDKDGNVPAATVRRLEQAYNFVQSLASQGVMVDNATASRVYRTEYEKRVQAMKKELGGTQGAIPGGSRGLPVIE